MRVATKLSGALALLLVLMVALIAYHVRTMRDLVSNSRDLSEISTSLVLGAAGQLRRLTLLEENASKYGITGDPRYLERFAELVKEYEETQQGLRALPVEGVEATAIAALTREWRASQPEFGRFLSGEGQAVAVEEQPPGRLTARLEALRQRTRDAARVGEGMIGARNRRSASVAREAERLSMFAAGGALLLSILVSVLIVRSISDALRRLQMGTHAVAGGDFSYRLPITKRDEFAELARDFNVMTQRLGELDRTQRDFLSKISHDLKTPLASIQETTRLLLDEVPGTLTSGQRRLLHLSDQSARRLFSMIANILDLSGMEAGAFRLSVGRCDVASLVRAAVEQLEPMLLEREVEISTCLPPEAVALECDGERIVQVLVNLLENAVKFSPDGGEVRVEGCVGCPERAATPPTRLSRGDEEAAGAAALELAVADRGPGVAVAERERIFERFYQTGEGRRVWGRGVGLGLAICREIVSAHGGEIGVEENPGGGSIFRIRLPLRVARPESRSALLGSHAATGDR